MLLLVIELYRLILIYWVFRMVFCFGLVGIFGCGVGFFIIGLLDIKLVSLIMCVLLVMIWMFVILIRGFLVLLGLVLIRRFNWIVLVVLVGVMIVFLLFFEIVRIVMFWFDRD